jgi:hypothetical protein
MVVCASVGCAPNAVQDTPPAATVRQEPVGGNLARALEANVKPSDLERVAIGASRSDRGEDLDELIQMLSDARFLSKLDEKERNPDGLGGFEGIPGRRLTNVLAGIAKHKPAAAGSVFLGLARKQNFVSESTRVEALMNACGELKQPSKEILDFLEAEAKPGTWQAQMLIRLFLEMGSEDSIARIENAFFTLKEGKSRSLFTHSLIQIRDQKKGVCLYRRILERGVKDDDTRNVAVQTLFDLREEWYPPLPAPRYVPKVPDRREASDEILGNLLSVADLTTKLALTEESRASVQKGRKEIEEILEFRKSGKPATIAKHIKELDSASFQTRDQAARELRAFGGWAIPQLRAALENPASAEARTRIDRLIQEISKAQKKKTPQ